MSFKSLVIFALVASLGRVMAAPLASRHLGAGGSCQGIWCARYILTDGHPDLSRRLAQFDGSNVTLSSTTPGEPTPVEPYGTPVDPSSTISSINPSSTPSVGPSSSLFVDPSSSTPSVDPFVSPSRTPSVDPSSSTPLNGGPVTVTIISTVFVNPTQSPTPSDSLGSSSLPVNPSSTLSGDPSSSTPSNTVPGSLGSLIPTLSDPNGLFTSFSSPAPTLSPTIVELTVGVPNSSVSSDPAGQPTPSPTANPGIIFLPPSGDGA